MKENEVPEGDKTKCGCKADDPLCYCDENGKKKFRKIPSNG